MIAGIGSQEEYRNKRIGTNSMINRINAKRIVATMEENKSRSQQQEDRGGGAKSRQRLGAVGRAAGGERSRVAARAGRRRVGAHEEGNSLKFTETN